VADPDGVGEDEGAGAVGVLPELGGVRSEAEIVGVHVDTVTEQGG